MINFGSIARIFRIVAIVALSVFVTPVATVAIIGIILVIAREIFPTVAADNLQIYVVFFFIALQIAFSFALYMHLRSSGKIDNKNNFKIDSIVIVSGVSVVISSAITVSTIEYIFIILNQLYGYSVFGTEFMRDIYPVVMLAIFIPAFFCMHIYRTSLSNETRP